MEKLEKLKSEIEQLEGEIRILTANRQRTDNKKVVAGIDEKIHSKQHTLSLKQELYRDMAKKLYVPAEEQEEIVTVEGLKAQLGILDSDLKMAIVSGKKENAEKIRQEIKAKRIQLKELETQQALDDQRELN